MHLSAAIPRFRYFEDMYIRNPLHDVLATPLPAQRDSVITLTDEPGLGLALDDEKLRGFSRDGAGWRDC
jgi:L-alanine-DL-glutamate epimerase-like enolase superfamily enzyme